MTKPYRSSIDRVNKGLVNSYAQRLGLHIVAEGVETESQLQILSQLGCDVVQGYLLGKPQTLEKTLSLWS